MPRPRLPKSQRLTEVTFIKLRRAERRLLDQLSRREKRSRSAIMRDAFTLYQTQAARFDVALQIRVAAKGRK
ncbi:MAG: ribbon-helix-helix protein, CopG family [Vicinamibacterales bacterium]